MSRRVLIVDDEKQMVKTLCDIFRLHGWDAHGAFSGQEAIAAVAREPFNIVLMDIRMPGMSGVDALRAIRASNSRVRVVLMTAYSASELIEQAIQEGALRVLSKPVAVPALLQLLDQDRKDAPVLVVDDDRAFLRTLAGVLREKGYPVEVAENLPDALALLERRAPGVIVLDLRLGDIAPRDSIIAVRDMYPTAVLILCSGYPALLGESERMFPDGRIYARLEKPFPPEHLMELLDEIY